MRILLYTLPVAFLVAYSQIVVKWRSQSEGVANAGGTLLGRYLAYFSDFYIISAYFVGLLASFIWLIVVSRIPLSIGFPVYIGSTFLFVLLGSWFFLNETISAVRVVAAVLIFFGIVLGALE